MVVEDMVIGTVVVDVDVVVELGTVVDVVVRELCNRRPLLYCRQWSRVRRLHSSLPRPWHVLPDWTGGSGL